MKHTLAVMLWVWINAAFVYKNLLYLIWRWLFSQLAPLKHKELFPQSPQCFKSLLNCFFLFVFYHFLSFLINNLCSCFHFIILGTHKGLKMMNTWWLLRSQPVSQYNSQPSVRAETQMDKLHTISGWKSSGLCLASLPPSTNPQISTLYLNF